MLFNNLQVKQLQLIALIIIPLLMTACGSRKSDQPITEIDWQWHDMVETEPAAQSIVPNPENYTLRLLPDGAFSVKADCNMASGSYELKGSNLSFGLGPTTLAYCGDDSLDHIFLRFLGEVERYVIENGQLILELKDGAGRMTFK